MTNSLPLPDNLQLALLAEKFMGKINDVSEWDATPLRSKIQAAFGEAGQNRNWKAKWQAIEGQIDVKKAGIKRGARLQPVTAYITGAAQLAPLVLQLADHFASVILKTKEITAEDLERLVPGDDRALSTSEALSQKEANYLAKLFLPTNPAP